MLHKTFCYDGKLRRGLSKNLDVGGKNRKINQSSITIKKSQNSKCFENPTLLKQHIFIYAMKYEVYPIYFLLFQVHYLYLLLSDFGVFSGSF